MLENKKILTALITPFNDDDQIDYPALDALADRLIHEHSDGFVIGATTGESPTLTHDEKIELFNHFTQHVQDKAVVVANVGNNSTAASVALAKEASAIHGITAVLAVNPYYNKPSQAGMVAHFKAIADASAVPVILYNIPGRTVVKLDNETVVELSKYPNIGGVKQCTSVSDLKYLVENTSPDFAVYTGEDTQTLGAIGAGARGVISVTSHLYGNEMHDMITAFETGKLQAAQEKMRWLAPRMDALFAYPSPEPVKMVLAARGEIANNLRLPMIPLTTEEAQAVNAVLEAN
ncbi:4-hydroxy-tetrahydrodipicolinate synthase [Lapidilactobacillus mulanensis]|uniref:4-hydroxy-tetrahydrodipicolinate synthase n=1 Tax=Lapidilactobacillus mulanensis TaxID=2485999 RepID=A0ABW4DJZ3_9LACO|nr:4-hydroxy-tetrahydrodipicolinate synthase [Lapidilactobacillus mulanensis]